MRKVSLVVLVGLLSVATAMVVAAAGARGRGEIDARTHAWTDEDVTTTSAEWTAIPGLRTRTGCQGNDNASATVSLELAERSDPVQVRVVMDALAVHCDDCPDGDGLLNPSTVTFGGEGASSYTFVGRTPGKGGSFFTVQWRTDPEDQGAPSATVESGTLDVLWKEQGGRGSRSC